MQRRDSSIALPGYNGTNVWFAPGTAINSTEAFHHASDLEEAAYLANRYMFIAMMVIMLAYVLAQMPYTFLRMKAHGAWQGFRLRKGVSAKHSDTPRRLRHQSWPIPIRRVPFVDLPLSEFLLVAVLWAAGLGVAGWCQATFLTDASRSTLVVMSLLALTAGLGIKAGGIGTWVVHGYTAVNFLHRWTGRVVLLLSTLHVIAYLVVFYQAGSGSFIFGDGSC
jgi:ferric-chelate reductase